ncbi:hypothetical protein GPECTOR_5g197 [Gonium pectorale]|uniref:Protein kinase domain-containing protein n=1 Tax=Gonium pectorale TaxID=33097 RepID=A0A150GWK9_GONPE|nr:hypothetical protein GPECTOR_5g197 [Gonium pectorale]|eukprot:KXZ54092.1 hypothetical protein GPECTOR_5g197 [Gonium pectorale]
MLFSGSSQQHCGLPSGRSGVGGPCSSSGPVHHLAAALLATNASWHPVEEDAEHVSGEGLCDKFTLDRAFTRGSRDSDGGMIDAFAAPGHIVPLPAAEGLLCSGAAAAVASGGADAAVTVAAPPGLPRQYIPAHQAAAAAAAAVGPLADLTPINEVSAVGALAVAADVPSSGGSQDTREAPQRRATLIRGLTRDSFLMNNTAGGGAGSGGYMMRTTAREEHLHTDSFWPPFQMGNPLQVQVGEMLGRGGCGSVYLGVWRGRPVAIKVVQQVAPAHAAAAGGSGGAAGPDAPPLIAPLIDYFGSSSTGKLEDSLPAAAVAAAVADAAASGGGAGRCAPHLPDAHASVKRLRHPNVLRTYAYAALSAVPQAGTVLPTRHEHHVVLELCDGGSLRGWLDLVWRGGGTAAASGAGGGGGGRPLVATGGPAETAAAAKAAMQAAISRAHAHIMGGLEPPPRAGAGAAGVRSGDQGAGAAAAGAGAAAVASGPEFRRAGPSRPSLDLPPPRSSLDSARTPRTSLDMLHNGGAVAAALREALGLNQPAFGSARPGAGTGTGSALTPAHLLLSHGSDAALPSAATAAAAVVSGSAGDSRGLPSQPGASSSHRLPGLTPAQSQQLQLLGMAWLEDCAGASGRLPTAPTAAATAAPGASMVVGASAGDVRVHSLERDGGGLLTVAAADGEGSCVSVSAMSEPSMGTTGEWVPSAAAGRMSSAGVAAGSRLPSSAAAKALAAMTSSTGGAAATAAPHSGEKSGNDGGGRSAGGRGVGGAVPCEGSGTAAAAGAPAHGLPATSPLALSDVRSLLPPLSADVAAAWAAASPFTRSPPSRAQSAHRHAPPAQPQPQPRDAGTGAFSLQDGSSRGGGVGGSSFYAGRHFGSSGFLGAVSQQHCVILEDLVEDDAEDCDVTGGFSGGAAFGGGAAASAGVGGFGRWRSHHHQHDAMSRGHYGSAGVAAAAAAGGRGVDHLEGGGGASGSGLAGLFGDLRMDEPLRRLEECSAEGPTSSSRSRSRSRYSAALDSASANTSIAARAALMCYAGGGGGSTHPGTGTAGQSYVRGWSSGMRSGGTDVAPTGSAAGLGGSGGAGGSAAGVGGSGGAGGSAAGLVLEHGSHTYLSRPSGTLAYLSPELLTTYRQSAAADQYAFGLLVWEVVTAQPLFLGMQTPQLLYAKTHNADWRYLQWPAWCPREVRALARRCADYVPASRLTAAQALEALAALHSRYRYQQELLAEAGEPPAVWPAAAAVATAGAGAS